MFLLIGALSKGKFIQFIYFFTPSAKKLFFNENWFAFKEKHAKGVWCQVST